MQREIGKLDGQLKSAQIDNDFLRDENTQICLFQRPGYTDCKRTWHAVYERPNSLRAFR